jgi:hypothetical protein
MARDLPVEELGGARRFAPVLARDPDLGEDLDPDQFELAAAEVVAPVIEYDSDFWDTTPPDFDPRSTVGLLMFSGLLQRGVTVGDYTCAELLGPGDVVQPWLRIGPEQSVVTDVDWNVAAPVTVAVLDRHFVESANPWPQLYAALARRLMQRSHWLSFHLAVCGLRRVEDRLLIVLWHFADRWGTMTPEGVRLDLRLTHELLASVIGARRPSVSGAVKTLVHEDRVRQLPRSRWLLLGRAPSELQALYQAQQGPERLSAI